MIGRCMCTSELTETTRLPNKGEQEQQGITHSGQVLLDGYIRHSGQVLGGYIQDSIVGRLQVLGGGYIQHKYRTIVRNLF